MAAARPLTPLVDESTDWGVVEWWRLEMRSFDGAPHAQRKLGQLGPREAWSKELTRLSAAGCLVGSTYIMWLVAPMIAAIAMASWWSAGSANDAMPLAFAGKLMSATLVVTVYGVVTYLRRPTVLVSSAMIKFGLLFITCDAIVILVVLGAVNGDRFDASRDPSLWWLLPFVIDAAIQVWQLAMGSTTKRGPQNDIEDLDARIRRVDPEVQQRIMRARNEAIGRLQVQGKIDRDTERRAVATELGHLGLTMAPRGRSSYDLASPPTRALPTDLD